MAEREGIDIEPPCCTQDIGTRQRNVYIADKHKQRYEEAYDPDLDYHYDLYLHPHSYL